MGFWVKRFAGGDNLYGDDRDIARRYISWSRTRLHGMVGALLVHDDFTIEISGPGEYWQSEGYEASLQGSAVLVKRRIEKQIDPYDRFINHVQTPNGYQVFFNTDMAPPTFAAIPTSWVGKWLIVEYDVRTKKALHYVANGKI